MTQRSWAYIFAVHGALDETMRPYGPYLICARLTGSGSLRL